MFPATRPSIVRDLGSVDPAARAAAFDALARSYWQPVYAYLRLRWRRGPDDAQDLTQEFFARAFERDYLARYDPRLARFRTFVRTCLDGFLANQDQFAFLGSNLPLLLKGLARTTQDGAYGNSYACQLNLNGFFPGLNDLVPAIVRHATHGGVAKYTPKCRGTE